MLNGGSPRFPARDDVAHAAKDAFLEAHSIARRQQAPSLELRAAISLARLSRSLGRRERDRGRAVLAEAYRSLGEGHDTSDARSARALLSELD